MRFILPFQILQGNNFLKLQREISYLFLAAFEWQYCNPILSTVCAFARNNYGLVYLLETTSWSYHMNSFRPIKKNFVELIKFELFDLKLFKSNLKS